MFHVAAAHGGMAAVPWQQWRRRQHRLVSLVVTLRELNAAAAVRLLG